MLGSLGPFELVVILVVVLLLFGVGRISRIGGELGKGIRAFKDGLSGDEEGEAGQGEEQDGSG